MSYYVYIHTCPNNKRYIGITKQSLNKRWQKGNGYKSNKHFYSAIQKYGWDNISHEVFEVVTENEMYYLEKYLISYYQSNKKDTGYNKSLGGEIAPIGCIRTEETKKKISESKKGQKAWNKGMKGVYKTKPCSEETKKRISESHKGVKRKAFSDEARLHMSEAHRGKVSGAKGKHWKKI